MNANLSAFNQELFRLKRGLTKMVKILKPLTSV